MLVVRTLCLATFVACFVLAACRTEHSHEGRQNRSCGQTGNVLVDSLAALPAVAALPRDLRSGLIDALRAPGRLCLSAPTLSVSCNAGDARAPSIRRCCKFARSPAIEVIGIPRRIRIRREGKHQQNPAVDLKLQGVIEALSLDQRCEAPTCEADLASARPRVDVSGRLSTGDTDVAVDLRIDLATPLELTCELPSAADD